VGEAGTGAGDGPTGDDSNRDRNLDLILEEVDSVVDPIAESVTFGPAVGIAVAGGPLVPMPPDEVVPGHVGTGDSLRSGVREAGPVAIAGMSVNVAAALVVIAVARLLSSQAYGELAQLLGLFFILWAWCGGSPDSSPPVRRTGYGTGWDGSTGSAWSAWGPS